MLRFDAVVVGAGLAGLQYCRLLAGRGASILLVDRKRSVADAVHTTGIFVRKTFEDFGFEPGELGLPIRDVTLYSPSLRALRLASGHDEFRIGRMAAIYERMLADSCGLGVRWSPSTRFLGSERAEHGSLVRLETGGESWSVEARLLVGADGVDSAVASSLGLEANSAWIVGVEEVHAVGVCPRLHCFLDPELAPGYIAWIADDGGEMHVGVAGRGREFRPALALRRFRAKIDGLLGVSFSSVVERRGGKIPVGGILRTIASDRGLLVGDAAGAVSPFTAGGLDGALRLSTFAAEVSADHLMGSDKSALKRYRGGMFRSRFLSRRWMRTLLEPITSNAVIEAAHQSLRFPPLRQVACRVFFHRASFPDLPIAARRPISDASGAPF